MINNGPHAISMIDTSSIPTDTLNTNEVNAKTTLKIDWYPKTPLAESKLEL